MSPSINFSTIQQAIDAADPGATLDIPADTYNERITIDKPLTLQGPHVGQAIIDGSGLSDEPLVIILASDVTIKRLTIQNSPIHGIRVGSGDFTNISGVLIENNTIRLNSNAGIITNHFASMKIRNNQINNNGTVTGFNRTGIMLNPHGKCSIVKNQINNNFMEGIYSQGSDEGLRIENNTIKENRLVGINLAWNQRNTQIVNNYIYQNGIGGSEQGGIVIIQALAENISGNKLIENNTTGILWGWVPTEGPIPKEILVLNNIVKNNQEDGIFLFTQGAGGFTPPDLFPLEPTLLSNIISDNNRAGVYNSNDFFDSPGNSNPTVNSNDIEGNNEWGVFNGTELALVDATENWWGDGTGPLHPEENPGGMGDRVSDRVNFIPWLTSPSAPPEVQECIVEQIILQDYKIRPHKDEKTLVVLSINISGKILLSYPQQEVWISFNQTLKRKVLFDTPYSEHYKGAIVSQGRCSAKALSKGELEVSVCTLIIVTLFAKVQLLIPSYGYSSIPSECMKVPDKRPFNSRVTQAKELKGSKLNYKDAVNVKKVYGTCTVKGKLNFPVYISF
ncbi:right-handed parallel beta-helix repeat-containing protein [Proteinivorax tanatarense]|uniref:Right-handed parallel beta-helix repeat-containing protein n=1 Tax=Proteinivorax tanatarense TaxID=1260629 RepID=A0AAU7VP74_9FIRM